MEGFVAAGSNKSSTSRPCSIQGNLSEDSELGDQSENRRKRRVDDAKGEGEIPSPSKKRALKHMSPINSPLSSADSNNPEIYLNADAEITNDENAEQRHGVSASTILSAESQGKFEEAGGKNENTRENIRPLTNKSFFTSERLSELLQSLPSEQFEIAKESCEVNRLPPILAAEIQNLKLEAHDNENGLEQTRGIYRNGLLIRAEHFGPDIKKWAEEGRSLLLGHSNNEGLNAFEDFVSENNDSELDTKSLNATEGVESDPVETEFEPAKLVETVKENQQESAENVNDPESYQIEEDEFSKRQEHPNSAIDIMEDEENNPKTNDVEQPNNNEQNENIGLNDSDCDCVITGESLFTSESPQNKILSARKWLDRATTTSKLDPRFPLSHPYPRSRYSSVSSLPTASITMSRTSNKQVVDEEEYSQRCSLGREYIKAVKNAFQIFGISEDVAESMSVLALSADFLVPSGCVFGRPHLVEICLPNSSREELCFLIGDVLRIKLLKVGCFLEYDFRKLFDQLLDDCQKKIHFSEYQDVRVRTDEGFQRISDNWLETVFSIPHGFLLQPLLPLVPIPSLNLYTEITRILTGPRFDHLRSWINVVEPSAFASAAVSSVSQISVPPSAITIDPWKVQRSDFFCPIKARFLQEFLGTKATEKTSLILALPLAKEPLQLLTALLDPVLKDFAVACGPRYTLHFASIGFVYYLFYRLFMHFYIGVGNANPSEIAELRSKFHLIEEKEDDVLFNYDIFTLLYKVNCQAISNLKILTECTPKLLIAGACLQANFVRNHKPDDYTEEDESRRLLYSSPDEARHDILELFKFQIRTAIINLLESINEANDFFTKMTLSSLKMFHQPSNQVGNFVAHQLLGLGFTTIHDLDSKEGFLKFEQSGDKIVTYENAKLAIKHLIFKRKSLKLRRYNLLHIIPKMARQVTYFRQALMHARRCLSDNWWTAFHNKSADANAKDSIVILKQKLKKLFGIIECWTRVMYNVVVRGTGEEMLNSIKLEHGPLVEFLYKLEFKLLPLLNLPPRECKMEEEEIESNFQLLMPQSILPLLPTLAVEESQNSVESSPSKSSIQTLTTSILPCGNPCSADPRPLNPTSTTSRPLLQTAANATLVIPSSNVPQQQGALPVANPPLKTVFVFKNTSNLTSASPRSFCPSILKPRRRPQPFVQVHNTVGIPTAQTVNTSSTANTATPTNNVASNMVNTRPSGNPVRIRNLGSNLLVTKPEPPDNSQQKGVTVAVSQSRLPDSIERTDQNHPPSSDSTDGTSKILSHQPPITTSTGDSDYNNGGVM
nr:hypothetical transcript [Hymenolepis microstoma]